MYDVFEQLLQKHNVTAYRVAKEAGVTQTALSNWKSGRSTPSTPTLQKIADYFGVSVDYLVNGQDAPKEMAPELTARDRRDIAKDLDRIMNEMAAGEDAPLCYNGEPIP
ncbi:MAG: helix-turn-helix domain-containing protein, partial [Eisenbergiella sp.]